MFDHLETFPAADHPELLAPPVVDMIHLIPDARVFRIDPELAETAALVEAYGIPLKLSANCVIVTGRRGDVERSAACMTLATHRVDVNSVVRRRLEARKASFAPMDWAVEHTGMEYGGITPVGLPEDLPIWIDEEVASQLLVCIGSGIRASKLIVPAASLLDLPHAELVDELAKPA